MPVIRSRTVTLAALCIAVLMAACAGGSSRPKTFDEAMAQFDGSTSKVTYRVETMAVTSDPHVNKLVVYRRGHDRRRLDTYADEAGTRLTGIVIVRGDQVLACIPDASGGGSCGRAPANAQTGDAFALGLRSGRADSPPTRTISGTRANCYAADSSGTARACVSSDGTLLSYSFSLKNSRLTLDAIETQGDVADGDFEPPFPVSGG